MASLGHVAIGLAAGRAYFAHGRRSAAEPASLGRAMFAFSVVSLFPDADVLAFPLGIPYGAPFGHRGASHSLAAALLVAIVVGIAGRFDQVSGSVFGGRGLRAPAPSGLVHRRPRPLRVAIFTGVVMATHGILDAMTDGGRGVALLFPFSSERFFLPWRPIPVAPIGIGIVSQEGLHVLTVELVAFLPFLLYALVPRRLLRFLDRS